MFELAFDYLALGQSQEAIKVLENAIKNGPSGNLAVDKTRIHPMLYYTLGYLYDKERRTRASARAIRIRNEGRSGVRVSPSS